MKSNALCDSSLLDDGECLAIFSLPLAAADQPLRYHAEYELSVVPDAGEAQLRLCDEVFSLKGPCLVLLAPGLPHAWSGAVKGGYMVRFGSDLLGSKFLGWEQMKLLNELLEHACRGIILRGEAANTLALRCAGLSTKTGFSALLELLGILHGLSLAGRETLLSRDPEKPAGPSISESRINSAVTFMKTNFYQPISLDDVARKARMTKGAFCRSIRKRTGKTYAESLSEIRIGHICRMLVETSENVSELAYRAGYNNIAHFHRSFRRLKGCTPKEFREANAARR